MTLLPRKSLSFTAMREPGLEPGCREAADPKSTTPPSTHYRRTAPTRTEAGPNRTGHVTSYVTRGVAAIAGLVLRALTHSGLRGWA